MGRREGKKEEKFRLVSLFCELGYDFIGSVGGGILKNCSNLRMLLL